MNACRLDELREQEISCHRWLESQRAGRDLGAEATRDWMMKYDDDFRWWKHLDHVTAKQFFTDFRSEEFGILNRMPQQAEVKWVLDRCRQRGQRVSNLELLLETQADSSINLDKVLEVLAILDPD